MPDKQPPPDWLLVVLAALMGVVAQLGASLALDMAKDRTKLYGFLLLSLVFSSTTTILTAQLTAWDDYVCAAIGTLVGAVPALWTLRAGVKAIGKKYDVDLSELTSAPPSAPPTAPPTPPTGGENDGQ